MVTREHHARGHARRRRRQLLVTALLTTVVGLASACSSGGGPSWRDGGDGDPPADSGPKLVATITGPADKSDDVPAAAEISFTTENAVSATIAVKEASGAAIKGAFRATGPGGAELSTAATEDDTDQVRTAGTWVPDKALKYGTRYSATVTATRADGKTTTATSTFTTMGKPDRTVRSSSFLGDDMVVGVGMPLVITFGRSIPKDMRDDVQRRLFVRTTPAQEGAWNWVSGSEVRYRPKTYWKANTSIWYRVALDGQPVGDGFFGRSDYTVELKTGNSVIMVVDDRTHRMTVTRNGKVVRTIPVSLGRPSMPSSSGTTLIMEKFRNTIFDTMNDPNPANRYRTPVEYAQRLTWGGEFIHAAPWSVADQGRRNVSHGCINMSLANAAFLFGLTNRIGDPVTVKGTPRQLQAWNGWTDWNFGWETWTKGSAIPYQAPAPSPSPADPSASPAPSATP